MKIEKALAVVQSIGQPRRGRRRSMDVPRPSYVPAVKPWTWAGGTPAERADAVRATASIKSLSSHDLCELFCLTPLGAIDILRGQDWRPEHSQ